jgi:membrane-associated protease RseP (regulator of RpoE activity)
MNSTIAIVVFFVGLLFIILIHEAGHYTVARAFGFKVEEYFVGFGPRIWSFRRGEIDYGIKALPLGGYVKIAGMNPYEPVAEEDLPRAYSSKPIWQRALTIFAGPGSHFVVAAVLFAVWLFFFGDPRTAAATAPVVVEKVDTTLNGHAGPAFEAGLKPGDTVVSIGGVSDPNLEEVSKALTGGASDRPGQAIEVTVMRDGQTQTLSMVPELADVDGVTIGRVGVRLALPQAQREGVIPSLVGGVKLVGQSIKESFQQIGHVFGPQGIGRVFRLLFTDTPRTTTDSASVIGIGQQVGATGAAGDWGTVLYFLAFVTVFIGLLNLIPLPPFDGGHLAVLGIEKIRGKAVDMRRLIPVSAAVMAFFVVFVLATVVLDFTKPIPAP